MRKPTVTALAFFLAAVTTAAGQTAPATRWAPWLGCWQQLEQKLTGADSTAEAQSPTRGVLVCVSPGPDAGSVSLKTVVEGHAALEETIAADGSRRPLTEAGCQGWQEAQWSTSGRRLFARAELACGDGATRRVSGLTTMARGGQWIDIQVVGTDGEESIRVRRYRRAPDQSRAASGVSREQLTAAAALAADRSAPLSLDEVKEASARLAPSAVEAALVETKASFPLNSRRLIELDEAGVPDRVIDLMVALSFPDKFIVERRAPASAGYGGGLGLGPDPWGLAWGGSWPYYYAPFGYASWALYDRFYYGGGYFGAPGYVLGGGAPDGPEASGAGRVVDGFGYTRVREREPQPVSGEAPSMRGGGAAPMGIPAGGGGGGVTTDGYSGGGGGGSSGRTAQPRSPE